jgi:hypothetical protein
MDWQRCINMNRPKKPLDAAFLPRYLLAVACCSPARYVATTSIAWDVIRVATISGCETRLARSRHSAHVVREWRAAP